MSLSQEVGLPLEPDYMLSKINAVSKFGVKHDHRERFPFYSLRLRVSVRDHSLLFVPETAMNAACVQVGDIVSTDKR